MLKRLIVSATSLEVEAWLAAKGFADGANWGVGLHRIDAHTDLLITGVGAASCACMLGAHLAGYSSFYHVGFAGAYAHAGLRVGQCVTVRDEAFAHYALVRDGSAQSLGQAGFAQAAPPQSNGGWAATRGEVPPGWRSFPAVGGLTVECPSTRQPDLPSGLRYTPSVETMEGAAFALAMASAASPPGRQYASLRAISNHVRPGSQAGWDIPQAKRSLAQALLALDTAAAPALRWAISPCPNDTFIFAALAQGVVAEGICHSLDLLDIATLNEAALAGRYDVVKVSAALYPALSRHYAMLPTGGALGYGVGPLLVSAHGGRAMPAAGDEVLIPGRTTTANALLRLFCPGALRTREVLFSDVIPGLLRGDGAYGVLIHEGRFTYQQQGLHLVADLGALWEQRYGLPLPLGIICVRRGLGEAVQADIAQAIRRSLCYAWAHREAVQPYVAQHAQELHPAVQAAHIHLYVNGYTYALGAEGQAAMAALGEALR